MKAFYVHHQTHRFAHRRGFTAYIQPTDNPRTVLFSVTYCSKKDAFCKKTGRESVAQLIPTEVNKRDVPKLLLSAECFCYYGNTPKDFDDISWQYIYRYML